MDPLSVLLLTLLILSLLANGYQWHKWNSYRTKPAGAHSHTAMMPKITPEQVVRDRDRQPRPGPSTSAMEAPKPLPPMGSTRRKEKPDG